MGTRLARTSFLTISGFLGVFRISGAVAVVWVSATATVGDPFPGRALASDCGKGLLVVSFTSLFFLGNRGLAIIGYSLHTPKFRNDWICWCMNNICLAPAQTCGYQISVDSWVTSTIARPGLWKGAGCTKKCDAVLRNSGNETEEANANRCNRAVVRGSSARGKTETLCYNLGCFRGAIV